MSSGRSNSELVIRQCLKVIERVDKEKLILDLANLQCLRHVLDNTISQAHHEAKDINTLKKRKAVVAQKIGILFQKSKKKHGHRNRRGLPTRNVAFFSEMLDNNTQQAA